jgi:vacuolar iron transporter family protein
VAAGTVAIEPGQYVPSEANVTQRRRCSLRKRPNLSLVPGGELAELTTIYEAHGLTRSTADRVAREFTAYDAFAAHVRAELGKRPG